LLGCRRRALIERLRRRAIARWRGAAIALAVEAGFDWKLTSNAAVGVF